MSKSLKLDNEEQELLDSYERNEWKSTNSLQRKIQQYQTYATANLAAEGLISIVLSKEDLEVIQQKAAEAGTSYQTLIARIVHQFVSGSLIERPHD
ncbi:MAG: antitoxin [Candidatus Poribacteria bacterium]